MEIDINVVVKNLTSQIAQLSLDKAIAEATLAAANARIMELETQLAPKPSPPKAGDAHA